MTDKLDKMKNNKIKIHLIASFASALICYLLFLWVVDGIQVKPLDKVLFIFFVLSIEFVVNLFVATEID